MKRLLYVCLLIALLVLSLGIAASDGIQVVGVIGASEHEADEGYFALGPDSMLMVKPGSPAHQWLKNKIGQRIVIVIEPDTNSQ